ncbi:MAG: ABC transporter permease [Bacteroidetes bacterium]|nr:MAG: ABC transporter permease [Bacteroidota bacterium]
MNKLWLIFKREYSVRVRKRTFIIATILMPIAIAALAIGSGYITAMGADAEKKILVKDDSGIFKASDVDHRNLIFTFSESEINSLKESYGEEDYDLLVYIPPFNDLSLTTHDVEYFSHEKPGIVQLERIERVIAAAFKEYKIQSSNIDRDLYDSFGMSIEMESKTTEDGAEGSGSGKTAAIIGTILGFVMGILMYMVILIYGQMVMRSVMEEKISRIAEVMISSVRPFQLMMGKILGVGAVGLTQLGIWMILIPVVLTVVPLFVPGLDSGSMTDMSSAGASAEAIQQAAEGGFDLGLIIDEFMRLNWLMIIPVFILFFLGGYFIYSSVFAAIGSAVDEDLGEAQQFMLPVILPVILAFMIMMSTIENPNSGLAVFGSIFPLFSPIIMPARLPFDPPMWEIALSLFLLIATTLLFIWLSGRIYRVGILMYGKKITFRELGRWMFTKI